MCFQRSLCLQFGALFCYFSTVCLSWSSELLQRIKEHYSSITLNTSEYIVTCFSHLSRIWGTYSHLSCLKLFKLPWRWFFYSHTIIATNLQWQVSLGGLSLRNLLNEIYIFLSKKNDQPNPLHEVLCPGEISLHRFSSETSQKWTIVRLSTFL